MILISVYRKLDKVADDIDVVKYLMENGANLTEMSNNGWTLLHFAAHNHSYKVVTFLVEEKDFSNYF